MVGTEKQIEAQRKAIYKYCKNNTVCYCLRLNKNTDKEIIKLLNKQKNKNGFIKKLIKNQSNRLLRNKK